MKFIEFLKDKVVYLFSLFILVIFITLLLYSLNINSYGVFFVDLSILLTTIVPFLFEFYNKKHFYENIINISDSLDKKYLISELIDSPKFIDGKILYEFLKTTNKSMNDKVAEYNLSANEYKEYIETWVHEVKTPIASAKLIIENNKNDVTHSINEEIDKIDKFVEQALYYSKINVAEKDYYIREIRIRNLIVDILKKNSRLFINSNISIEILDLENNIFCDSKWLEFIINQVISNSIKYKSKHIRFSAIKTENNVCLYIKDDGIGIDKTDIERVFEKGFTGNNGRKIEKSTGIGLYLCKELCKKLGIELYIESEVNIGTTVKIIFPIGSMHNI